MKQFVVPLVLMLMLAGCGNESPIPPPTTPPTTPAPPVTPPITPPIAPPVTPPTTPPGAATLTGAWSGTTVSDEFGTEQTAFTFTQSGSQVSGTLVLTDSEGESFSTPVTGSVSSSSATVSALYDLDNGSELEYRYEGIFSDTTYSGNVTLLVDGAAQQQGQFSVTKGAVTPPTTPPTTPPVSNSISGTVTVPAGGDVSGTLVAACASEACDPAIDGLSNGVQITQSGASATYDIPLQAGQYVVFAAKLLNDDDVLDPGEYIGFYPTLDAPQPVPSPANGIDIEMQGSLTSGSLLPENAQVLSSSIVELFHPNKSFDSVK